MDCGDTPLDTYAAPLMTQTQNGEEEERNVQEGAEASEGESALQKQEEKEIQEDATPNKDDMQEDEGQEDAPEGQEEEENTNKMQEGAGELVKEAGEEAQEEEENTNKMQVEEEGAGELVNEAGEEAQEDEENTNKMQAEEEGAGELVNEAGEEAQEEEENTNKMQVEEEGVGQLVNEAGEEDDGVAEAKQPALADDEEEVKVEVEEQFEKEEEEDRVVQGEDGNAEKSKKWIDESSIDWSQLTEKEAAKLRKKIEKQEKKRKRSEKNAGDDEEEDGKEKKKHKKDKKEKKHKKDKKEKKEKKEKKGRGDDSDSGEDFDAGQDMSKEEEVEYADDQDVPPPLDISELNILPISETEAQGSGAGMPMTFEVSPAENFKNLMSKLKKPRGKAIPAAELEMYADTLVTKMIDADASDRHAIKEGRPAVNKLRYLPEVRNAMSKAYLQEFLVRQGILRVIGDWLEPIKVPKKGLELPNYDIRSTMLDILLNLPLVNDPARLRVMDENAWEGIAKEDLANTDVGKRVSMMAQHKKETVENQHKAEVIIERWSRLLFEVSRDYKKMAQADARRGMGNDGTPQSSDWVDPLASLPAENIHGEAEVELKARQERYKRRILRPQRQMMNFHYRPRSEFTPTELARREGIMSAEDRLKAMMKKRSQELKSMNKTNPKRSHVMSIEGGMSTMPQGPA